MTEAILKNPRVYAVQNGLAGLVFALLLTAELLRHLLNAFPGIELFWRLSSVANHTVAPILNVLSRALHSQGLMIVVLLVAVVIPLISWRNKNWLGTAVSGHVALASLVMLAWSSLHRNNTGHPLASLSNIFEARLYDTSAISMIVLSLVMTALCALNHVAFFRLPRR